MVYQAPERPFTNNLYFQQGATPVLWTEEELTELARALSETWVETMQGGFHETITLERIRAMSLETETAPSIVYEPSLFGGTLTGTRLPLHTAMSITFRTAKRGRSYRGRIYHYGLVEASLETQRTWSNTSLAGVQEIYENWMVAAAAEYFGGSVGLQHVQVSRQHDGVVLSTGVVTQVTAISPQKQLATQRPRVRAG